MPLERLTAFSDGVIAIITTIMVLDMKVPHSADWQALAAVLPVFLSYILSFVSWRFSVLPAQAKRQGLFVA